MRLDAVTYLKLGRPMAAMSPTIDMTITSSNRVNPAARRLDISFIGHDASPVNLLETDAEVECAESVSSIALQLLAT
jgi:hypothetical protein